MKLFQRNQKYIAWIYFADKCEDEWSDEPQVITSFAPVFWITDLSPTEIANHLPDIGSYFDDERQVVATRIEPK